MLRPESFTSIGVFKQCPKRYYYKYIKSLKRELENEKIKKGREFHKNVCEGKKSSDELDFAYQIKGVDRKKTSWFVKDVGKLVYLRKDKNFIEFNEARFALNYKMQVVEYCDPRAIFRGVVDHAKIFLEKEKLIREIEGKKELLLENFFKNVELLDWKTGKNKGGHIQLNYYALFFFAQFSFLDKISCKNVYVSCQETSPSWVIKRKQIEKIWLKLKGEIKKIRECRKFVKKTSPLCAFCEYKKDVCNKELLGKKVEGLFVERKN